MLGKRDIAALTALFAVLLNPSPAGDFFLPYKLERAGRAASTFCSFSSSSISQHEPGKNITATH